MVFLYHNDYILCNVVIRQVTKGRDLCRTIRLINRMTCGFDDSVKSWRQELTSKIFSSHV